MGDWNGKVGSKREHSIVGPYGIGERNNNGERLLDLCQQLKLTVMNTWFEQKESTAYTWTSPDKTTRNQMDYILVSERYKNSVKNAKARPSADCGSDHIPVVMTPKVILKKIKRKSREKRWNKEILKNEETKLLLSAALERKLGKEEKEKNEAKQSESETIRTKMRNMWKRS